MRDIRKGLKQRIDILLDEKEQCQYKIKQCDERIHALEVLLIENEENWIIVLQKKSIVR